MRSVLIAIALAGAALAMDAATCNQTFLTIEAQYAACSSKSPLLNVSALPTAIPEFCTGTGNCDAGVISGGISEFLVGCTPYLTDDMKSFIAEATAEATALCTKSGSVYCLSNAVQVYGVVAPMLASLDQDSEETGVVVPFNATVMRAQLAAVCNTGCIGETYTISVALKGATNLSSLLLLPTVVCMQDEGDYCFPQLVETMFAALQGASGYSAALKAIPQLCSACGHRIISAITRLGYSEMGINVPSWNDLCYTDDDGKLCLEQAIDGVVEYGVLENCQNMTLETSDKCSDSMKKFVKEVGCCAYSLVAAVASEDNDTAELLAAALPAKCEQSTSDAGKRTLVTLGLSNVNRTLLQEKWAAIKTAIAQELAQILGLDAKDGYDAWIENDSASASAKRADSTTANIVVDLRPSSTATTADNVADYAKAYAQAGTLQLYTLSNAGVAADSTKPVSVVSAQAEVTSVPGSAASTLTVATAMIVAALALLY